MTFKFRAAPTPAPVPSPRILPTGKETEAEVSTAVRIAQAEQSSTDAIADRPAPQIHDEVDESAKLSQLISDDFPFDDSQLEAIHGILKVVKEAIRSGRTVRGACMTGAAGTGKTTCTKKLVDELQRLLKGYVDMESYFARGEMQEDDDYEIVEKWVPAIVMCGFTGRSTQMIKKNFPRDWHSNIMTIHRMLAYMPEFYEDYDDESGDIKMKMRFIPTYDANNKLPWKVIIIDEAGMVGLELWHNIVAAMEPDTIVIMIGDINQLPPVHGRSVFGFAMSDWPSWELTHIHRQEGKHNPIVDNAWRILKGEKPESGGAFQMVKFDGLASKASQQVRKLLPTLQEKGVYDPIRDTTITPINGEDGARGFALGQLPLNREFAIIFNNTPDRFIIDAGRERKIFGVGDKVMATRNDHEIGVTNGMTGLIESIHPNPAYTGDYHRFGRIADVNAYMAGHDDEDDDGDIDIDELNESMAAMQAGKEAAKEKKERGPASHIVTVRFGHGEHSFEVPFATLAEVASLMTAYVVTCHKMQGGESPVVVIICHDAHKQMLNREWLYTAVTRASQKCILLYTEQALQVALRKQRIMGRTLAEKVKVFKELSTKGILGAAVDVTLNWWGRELTVPQDRSQELANLEAMTDQPEPEPQQLRPELHVHVHEHTTHLHADHVTVVQAPAEPEMVDGGDAEPVSEYDAEYQRIGEEAEARARLMVIRRIGYERARDHLRQVWRQSKFLLPYKPTPICDAYPAMDPEPEEPGFMQPIKEANTVKAEPPKAKVPAFMLRRK